MFAGQRSGAPGEDEDFTVHMDSVLDPLKPSSFEQLRATGGRELCDAFVEQSPEFCGTLRQPRRGGSSSDPEAAEARFKRIDKRLRHSLQRIAPKYEDFFEQLETVLLRVLGGPSASMDGVEVGTVLLQSLDRPPTVEVSAKTGRERVRLCFPGSVQRMILRGVAQFHRLVCQRAAGGECLVHRSNAFNTTRSAAHPRLVDYLLRRQRELRGVSERRCVAEAESLEECSPSVETSVGAFTLV